MTEQVDIVRRLLEGLSPFQKSSRPEKRWLGPTRHMSTSAAYDSLSHSNMVASGCMRDP